MSHCVRYFLSHESIYYGLWFSVVITTVCTIGSLWNKELFLQSYPPDVKSAYGPMSPKTRKQLMLFGTLIYLILLGIITLATKALIQSCGAVGFWPVFLNNWIILNLFNLIDLLILDWLFFVTIQPKFIILTGTAGLKGYKDYGFHFRGFLKGIVYMSAISLVASGVTLLF